MNLRTYSLAIFSGTLLLSVNAYAGQISSSTVPNVKPAPIMDMRGQRYCEVGVAQKLKAPEKSTIDIYNTVGLNNCPQSLWKNLSEEKVRQQTGSTVVRLNGPRYWVTDGVSNYKLINSKVVNIAGLDMWIAQIISVSWYDLVTGSKPYTPHSLQRKVTFIYQSGKPVYELIDPKGHVYIMQSYSLQKIYQSQSSLSNLNSTLTLPKGWKFRSRTLDQTISVINNDNKATVIRDDFFNAYQLEIISNK